MNVNIKLLFNEKESAFYIGMSRSFLRQGRMNGPLENKIPPPVFVKIGKRTIRYHRDDLDNWVKQFKKYRHTHETAIGTEEEDDDG